MRYFAILAGLCALLGGCSSKAIQAQSGTAATSQQQDATDANPISKYVELVGFRIDENGPGKLKVNFGVVNHSAANLGDLALNVDLRSTTSKPGDPPLCSFPVKVASLGPYELKEESVTVPTKLRAYELPDWQFLKVNFQITAPK